MPLNSDKPVHANWFLVSKIKWVYQEIQHRKLQTNPRDRDVEPQNIYSKKIPKRQQKQITSFLFLVKMIAKLERA